MDFRQIAYELFGAWDWNGFEIPMFVGSDLDWNGITFWIPM